MFKQLQEEHKVWAEKNFGKQDVEDYCLGMIEEVGELAHAVLKRKQGIRNNEDHDANIKDAIADIVIYLAGYCNCEGYSIRKWYKKHKLKNNVLTISDAINDLIQDGDEFDCGFVLNCLVGFCNHEGIDFEQAVKDTWKNVVSKRDWKSNPDCISSEEAKRIDYEDMGYPV